GQRMPEARMSHRVVRVAILAVGAMVALLPAGLYKRQAFGQGPAAAPGAAPQGPGGQAPGGRGGRGGGGRGGGQPAGPPPTPQAAATVDLTGYWVSLVTEDWRWRMKIPDKGDVASIPFTQDQTKRAVLQAWDPAKDEAEGNQCKAYGAAAIMRVPTRVHITWDNENVLKLETDAGMQTRLFRFSAAPLSPAGERTWQGSSVAEWEPSAAAAGRGGGRGGGGGGGGGAFPGVPAAADEAPPAVSAAGPAVRGDL